MQTRIAADPVRFARMTSAEIRASFLVDDLFQAGQLGLLYSEVDRCIIGSAVPLADPLSLTAPPEIVSQAFCDRRELGVLNVGAAGSICVDESTCTMEHLDGLYVGQGAKTIDFFSASSDNPAAFYLLSFPAHHSYPTRHIRRADAEAVKLGSTEAANKRTIYKLIRPGGVQSCQLVMGFTVVDSGSVWNTMPPHTHDRRMEVYLYFDMAKEARVFHLMGQAQETRHIVVADRQAVISPSWSIHAGAGTGAYTFCWGMGGENQVFDDMDALELAEIR
ncbi:MAG TPA: 5-dehydro-4-deoxy-D-glucuronate isomerase [bacterium]|nr:5-dehydro-4-deoxy-D-glucuronate isomerase [bacterium]HPG46630.1 5-dehydro-4-deoxy-D-glucuronate isomerase [bacterium]HPM98837.1 5-dehydro-4-deoxy-D-glucuronate isomerase [bacterium]